MYTYREFQDEFYHPRKLFKIAIQAGREVAHGIPVPDQLGWLISFPVVFVPMLTIAIAYANGYYLTFMGLWSVERIGVYGERLWRSRLVEYWRRYVPEKYRKRIEAKVPETDIEKRMRVEEKERKLKKLEQLQKQRGTGQKNVKKDAKSGRSFKDN